MIKTSLQLEIEKTKKELDVFSLKLEFWQKRAAETKTDRAEKNFAMAAINHEELSEYLKFLTEKYERTKKSS